MSRITILTDDIFMRQVLEQALEEDGCLSSCTFQEAKSFKGDGGACMWIGKEGEDAPAGFGIRNNDCFYKPVRFGFLLDRIYRHLDSRIEAGPAEEIAFGPYVMDGHTNTLKDTRSKKEIRLTDKEAKILQLLAEKEGRTVERKDLLHNVWGYVEDLETHTLETHIYRLRQKIEKNPAEPEILMTEENGYRLKMPG